MGRVSARIDLPVTAAQAAAVWFDVARWPSFVDGLRSVLRVGGGWPAAGAAVEWESHPGGRGHVVERVVEYSRASGQVLDIDDDGVTGRQEVAFRALPSGDGVRVALSLDYALRRRSPLTPLVDLLFIRRSQRESLERTLRRFGAEVTAAPPDAVQ
jgi:polyketide cyclase/dehydrase/lipid transport protein